MISFIFTPSIFPFIHPHPTKLLIFSSKSQLPSMCFFVFVTH